jgi:hypothetical protein
MPPCPLRPLPSAIPVPSVCTEAHSKNVRSMSDSPSAILARGYRAEAKRLREQATQLRWPDLRQQLEEVARRYELLVENIERKYPGDLD